MCLTEAVSVESIWYLNQNSKYATPYIYLLAEKKHMEFICMHINCAAHIKHFFIRKNTKDVLDRYVYWQRKMYCAKILRKLHQGVNPVLYSKYFRITLYYIIHIPPNKGL